MATDQSYARLYNKKNLALDQLDTNILAYTRGLVDDSVSIDYDKGTILRTAIPVVATGNNQVNVAATGGPYKATNGLGKVIKFNSLDARLQTVKIPPDAGVIYTLGLETALVEDKTEVNPRTGAIEYRNIKEEIGRVLSPSAVTWTVGTSTLKLTLNNHFETNKDNSGRTIRVWLKPLASGGLVGPQVAIDGPGVAAAFYEATATFDGTNTILNIVSATPLGQSATPSTTAADYLVLVKGPTVRRQALEDLSATTGAVFLGTVTSVAAANPIVTIATAQQRVSLLNLADMNQFFQGEQGLGPNFIFNQGDLGLSAGAGFVLNIGAGSAFVGGKLYTFGAASTLTMPASQTSWVYVDVNGVIQQTTTFATAWQSQNLILGNVITSGAAITSVVNEGVQAGSDRVTLTVGHNPGATNATARPMFTSLSGAIQYAADLFANATTASRNPPQVEILVTGHVDISTATITIPASCSGLIIRGVRPTTSVSGTGTASEAGIFWSGTGLAFDVQAPNVTFRDLLFYRNTATGTTTGKFIGTSATTNISGGVVKGCTFLGASAVLAVISDAATLASVDLMNDWSIQDCTFDQSLLWSASSNVSSFIAHVNNSNAAKFWRISQNKFIGNLTTTSASAKTRAIDLGSNSLAPGWGHIILNNTFINAFSGTTAANEGGVLNLFTSHTRVIGNIFDGALGGSITTSTNQIYFPKDHCQFSGNTIKSMTAGGAAACWMVNMGGNYCSAIGNTLDATLMSGTNAGGITLTGTTDCLVMGNVIKGTDKLYYGITASGVIVGNMVDMGAGLGSGGLAIVGSTSLLSIIGNTVVATGTGFTGISSNSSWSTVSNNTIRLTGSVSTGISCNSSADSSVSCNVILNLSSTAATTAGSIGILANGTRLNVYNNNFRTCRGVGIQVGASAVNANVMGNSFDTVGLTSGQTLANSAAVRILSGATSTVVKETTVVGSTFTTGDGFGVSIEAGAVNTIAQPSYPHITGGRYSMNDAGTGSMGVMPTQGPVVLTYSANMTISQEAEWNIATATNGTAFTFAMAATSGKGAPGARCMVTIKNTSGGALGAATFPANWKLGAAWVQPATGFNRTIETRFDGTNWIEIGRSAADVAN